MAVVLDSQKTCRPIQKLPFCYLCTKEFQAGEERNRDHLPPYKLFAKGDRDVPLILPTHAACNGERSAEDQIISQLAGVLHGRDYVERDRKMQFVRGRFADGSYALAIRRVDLRRIVRRWVRGFHAALYREALPESAVFQTELPLPEGLVRETGIDFSRPIDLQERIVEEIKKNRLTNSLDRIVCRNGQCRYECVWVQFDKGEWFCVYALDIYDWKNLGEITHFEPRGCRMLSSTSKRERLHLQAAQRDCIS